MDNITEIIGRNLKMYRVIKGYSLEKTAELTGVSKAMLGQIERGESNPTVTTLKKISTGLELSFTSLMNEDISSVKIIKKNELEPVYENNKNVEVYPIVPFNFDKQFEVYLTILHPGAYYIADPHNEGVKEHITVNQGTLEVELDNITYSISTDETIIFDGNKQHIYKNQGDTIVKCIMIINYS